jgi:hypothetical protein
MIIKPSGNVGIGTETPDSLLTVNGGVYVGGGIRAPGLPTALGTKALRINAQGQISVADTTLGGGTVISVGTNNGSGITGGPITVSGTLAIDTTNVIATKVSVTGGLAGKLNISDTASMLSPYLRKADTTAMLAPYLRAIDTASLSNRINLKLNISDTASMLGNYLNNVGYGLSKVGQVASADSATLSAYYLRRKDSLTTTNPLGYVTKKILADTAAAIRSSDAGGTVTSVATNNGTGITGGTITTSGTIAADTLLLSTRAWRQKGVDSVAALINNNISGTTNYIPRFSSTNAIDNSIMRESGTRIGINTSPFYNLDILEAGSATIGAGTANNKIVLNGDDNGGSISTTNTTYISFAPFQTEAMRITSSGVVNIGANFTNNSNKLNVGGSATIGYSTNVVGPTNGLSVNGSVGIGLNGVSTDSALSVLNGAYFQRGVRMSGLPSAPGTKALRIDAAGTISIADTLIDAGGTVTSVATNNGTGITGGTITTSGTLAIDTTVISTRAWRQKGIDSVAALINSNVSGTTNYVSKFTGTNTLGNSQIFDNGTNVGIANALPSQKFEVGDGTQTGQQFARFSFSATNLYLGQSSGTAFGQSAGSASLILSDQNNPLAIGTNQNQPMIFGTNNSERMRVASTGNVGIGTSSPDSMLTVTQGAHIQRGVRLSGLPTAPGTRSLRIDANGTLSVSDTLANGMSGSGTPNYIPKFTGSSSIGNSVIYESSSNIGIGTISPNYPLHINSTSNARIGVQGTTNFSAFQNINSSGSVYWGIDDNAGANFTGTAYGRFIYSSGAYPLIFFTNSTERMRLDASGNLGLGVTPSAFSGVVGLQLPSFGVIAYSSSGHLTSNAYFNSGWKYITGAGAAMYNHSGNEHQWQVAPVGTAGNAISFTQAMTLDASGNLGLGVTPSAWGNIFTALQIKNTSLSAVNGIVSVLGGNSFYNGTSYTYIQNGFANQLEVNNSGSFLFQIAPSGTAGNAITFTQAMTLDASGNLSIGNTSASGKVHITGGSSGADLLFLNTSGATTKYAFKITGAATDYFTLRRNHPTGGDLDIMSWTYGGNVGIGNTAPINQLDLNNTGAPTLFDAGLKANQNGGEIELKYIAAGQSGGRTGSHIFYTGTTVGGSERMRITSGGNVGIGTTGDASYKLLVKGNNASVDANGQNTIYLSAGTSVSYLATSYIGGGSYVPIAFEVGGSERMRITSSGEVLIGTTSTGAKLTVRDNANTFSTHISANNQTNGIAIGTLSSNNAVIQGYTRTFSATNNIVLQPDGGEVYIAGTTDQGAYNLQVNGTGVWGAGAYVNGSDRSLKENIYDLDGCLELVKQLKPVTYKYKESYSKDTSTQTGFIAQDLKELFKDKSYLNGLVKEGGQHLSVAYQNLIPLLVKAIQEQQAEIEILKNK